MPPRPQFARMRLTSTNVFKCVVNRFKKTGSVKDGVVGVVEQAREENEENIEKVRNLVMNMKSGCNILHF